MTADNVPYLVADLSLAAFGRKEIQLAEHEMPGLMAVRAEYAPSQPLRGARITGSLTAADSAALRMVWMYRTVRGDRPPGCPSFRPDFSRSRYSRSIRSVVSTDNGTAPIAGPM